jgi:ABC-2 type transport system permease protein
VNHRTIRTVAVREVRQRIRARSFAIATAALVLVAVAAIVAPALVDEERPDFDVGVVGSSTSLSSSLQALEATVGGTVTVRVVEDVDAARAQLRAGTLDLVVVPDDARMLVREEPEEASDLERLVGAAQFVAGLERAGIDPERAADAVARGYRVEPLEATDTDESAQRGAAFVAVVLLFVVLLTYGQWIATGVVEEKSSRIVEILLPAISSERLLVGKVLGISAVAFAQFGVTAAAAITAAIAVGNEVPAVTPGLIATTIACFVAGYAFYAALFAGAGSLVSRPEDVGSAVTPITTVFTAVYLVSLTVTPESPVITLLSYLPPSMPTAMPPRVATGEAQWWEVAVAVVVTLAAAGITMLAAARLYRGGLLRRGPKVRLRDAWRGAA